MVKCKKKLNYSSRLLSKALALTDFLQKKFVIVYQKKITDIFYNVNFSRIEEEENEIRI